MQNSMSPDPSETAAKSLESWRWRPLLVLVGLMFGLAEVGIARRLVRSEFGDFLIVRLMVSRGPGSPAAEPGHNL